LSSGNVGIGTTSPLQRLDVASSDTGVYQTIRSTSSGATNVALRIQDGTTGTTNSDGIYLGRTGAINYLWTYENEPWVFATNNTERMRINAGAPILCLAGGNTSATGTGIAFPATQSASSDANTLDDYEEGTWTPVLKGTSTNPVYTASQAQGSYVKVGKLVYVSFIIVVTGVSSQGTGNIYMDALPFSANDQSYAPTLTVMYNDTWDVDFRAMYASGISFTMRPIGVTQSNATWGGASTLSTGYFSGSGCYLTT
jgi:hypothetical protein